MIRTIKTGLAFTALAGAFLLQPTLRAQDAMKQESMKQDEMKHDKMQDGKMMNDGKPRRWRRGSFTAKYTPLPGARRCIKRRTVSWCCG